jgi:peptidoglycan/LPS O-acetylase OafA/YrhL
VRDNKIPLTQSYPYALLTFVSAIVIAYACLKLYDEPVRKWLQKKVLGSDAKKHLWEKEIAVMIK